VLDQTFGLLDCHQFFIRGLSLFFLGLDTWIVIILFLLPKDLRDQVLLSVARAVESWHAIDILERRLERSLIERPALGSKLSQVLVQLLDLVLQDSNFFV